MNLIMEMNIMNIMKNFMNNSILKSKGIILILSFISKYFGLIYHYLTFFIFFYELK